VSYHIWNILIFGSDLEFLESLVAEVDKNVDGKTVSVEVEDDVEVEAKECDLS